MRIHYCIACKFNKFFLGDKTNKINRFRCTDPDSRRKNGSFRILNKNLIMRGDFPKWCKLEDAEDNSYYGVSRYGEEGHIEHEKADH